MTHVFLIDDSEDLRFFGKRAVELAGYRCRAFAHADDAVKAMAGPADIPRLILTDYHMPGFDAAAFIAHLRGREEWRHVLVILVSGIADLKRVSTAIGADGCLRKPFDLARVETLLHQYLKAPPRLPADAP